MAIKYKRILLKLSGEAMVGNEGLGIDPAILDRTVQEIKELVDLGVQVGLVVGGGNIFRGQTLAKAGMNRVAGDHMGMLATVMNGLALRDSLQRHNVPATLMSAIALQGVCDTYNYGKAMELLEAGNVVIFSAGTGNPFFTTDTAACLRAIEIQADVVLKGTKVDGVYSADPMKDPNAEFYPELDYQTVLQKELQVMDLTAFTLARDHRLPIRIYNMGKADVLKKVVQGEPEGTLVTHLNKR